MLGTRNIILALLVVFIVIYLFEGLTDKLNESFNQNNIEYDSPKSHIGPIFEEIPSTNYVPLKEPQISTEYEVMRDLSESDIQRCPLPRQSIKQFNKDFFNFRDKTEYSTSFNVDPVDRIQTLDIKPDMAIKDYYDELVQADTDLYPNKTTRYPYFDNVMHDGYDASHVSGLHNVRDMWIYSNENIMNGGQVAKGLTPFNPEHQFFPSLESIIPLKE